MNRRTRQNNRWPWISRNSIREPSQTKRPKRSRRLPRALYKAGKLPEAESALAESLKSGRPHPDGAYYLSRILFAGGHKDQARLVAAQVLSPAINSPAPFLRREDTKALFDELKK